MTEKHKIIFAGLLFGLWLVATAVAFWWFQFRDINVFDPQAEQNQTVFFESGELGHRLEKLVEHQVQKDNTSRPINIVHFWNPVCSCNRFNEQHVKDIINEYADRNVKFTIVVNGETEQVREARAELAGEIFTHPAVTEIRTDWSLNEGPPSSPAAAIIDKNGQLTYFGPYSLGAQCTTGSGAFIENMLDQMANEKFDKKQGIRKQLNTLAVGCFCPWQENASLS